MIQAREYDFINNKGQKVTIQDHSHGHTYKDKPDCDEGPYFNVRKTGEDHSVFPETKSHYNFDK